MAFPYRTHVKILKASAVTAGFGIGGAFLGPQADVPAIIATWVMLMGILAEDAGVEMTRESAIKIVTAVSSGVALALTGIKAGSLVFAWSGIGTVPALILNCGLNATVTFFFGRSVAAAFQATTKVDSVDAFARNILAVVLASLGLPPRSDAGDLG